jgi:hypothetical protein
MRFMTDDIMLLLSPFAEIGFAGGQECSSRALGIQNVTPKTGTTLYEIESSFVE